MTVEFTFQIQKTINLPYSFTSILDDSMIMVNNFGAVNIVDLNGVVRLKGITEIYVLWIINIMEV